jgi:hypothetical protein
VYTESNYLVWKSGLHVKLLRILSFPEGAFFRNGTPSIGVLVALPQSPRARACEVCCRLSPPLAVFFPLSIGGKICPRAAEHRNNTTRPLLTSHFSTDNMTLGNRTCPSKGRGKVGLGLALSIALQPAFNLNCAEHDPVVEVEHRVKGFIFSTCACFSSSSSSSSSLSLSCSAFLQFLSSSNSQSCDCSAVI